MATTVESCHTKLIRLIDEQKRKESEQDIWKDSPYKDLVTLQSNNVGNVGEMLVGAVCAACGIPATCDGSKTKKLGGGDGDGIIMGRSVEIKTAHEGCKSHSFQHELGEVPWKAKFMIFLDISPQCMYLTIFKNFDEETYKNSEKLLEYFPTKCVTWRKKKGAFKLDTSVNINNKSTELGHAIKITSTTSNELIGSFVRKTIV